jgi:hypothetical protein
VTSIHQIHKQKRSSQGRTLKCLPSPRKIHNLTSPKKSHGSEEMTLRKKIKKYGQGLKIAMRNILI